MVDEEILRKMQAKMNQTWESVMGMTLHTETKRAFLRELIRRAQAILEVYSGRNISEEIHRHLTIMQSHAAQADDLMRQHCDLKHPGLHCVPRMEIDTIALFYQRTLDQDAPLERLAQQCDGPPLPTPPDFSTELRVDPKIFPGLDDLNEEDYSREELPF
jgi:hypothetical protein